jgi:hypothetical protein
MFRIEHLPAHHPIRKSKEVLSKLMEHRMFKRRKQLDELSEKLGIQRQEDWYGITAQDLNRAGAAQIIYFFGRSLIDVLRGLYPEFTWNPSLFSFVPRNHWKHKENQRSLFDWVAEQIGVHFCV